MKNHKNDLVLENFGMELSSVELKTIYGGLQELTKGETYVSHTPNGGTTEDVGPADNVIVTT